MRYLLIDFVDWLLADKEEKKFILRLPRNCRHCEVLGMCRDEDNNWKCHNGCWLINNKYGDDKSGKKRRRTVRWFFYE